MTDKIVATYLVRVTLRADAESEPAPPTNAALEELLGEGLLEQLARLGFTEARVSAERTDQ